MKTILLVEDDDFVSRYAARALERKGCKAILAAKGYEAIELYKEYKPQCVLLDVKLPDINGKEVLKKIKEIDPHANIYFITGSEEITSLSHAKELGAQGYLTKPIDLIDMVKIIEK